YGHRTLLTSRGKIFCIFYAILGIPMSLIMFQSAGERLNSILTYVLTRLKRLFNKKSTKITDGELLVAETLLSVITLLIGAFVFSRYEDWTFFDSFYYGFITLTTIGFGDFVVMQKDRDGKFWSKVEYFIFCMTFIFFGLTLLASSMNLLVLRLVAFYSEERLLERIRQEEQARQAVLLKGDVICSANKGGPDGSASGKQDQREQPETLYDSRTSVCSCTCFDTYYERRHKIKKRQKRSKNTKHHNGGMKLMKSSDSTSSIRFIVQSRRSSV
ncbi:unnamed protein product, partial [Didymodactylos carnosus]